MSLREEIRVHKDLLYQLDKNNSNPEQKDKH